MTRTRRNLLTASVAAAALFAGLPAQADDRLEVVASFSILADMVAEVGGDRVEVVALVGPDEDAHAFDPAPAHARMLAEADLVVVNGLGFEGWIERLVEASGYPGEVVVATTGVTPLEGAGEHHDEHAEDEHAEDEHAEHEHAEDEHAEDEHAEEEHAEEEHAEEEGHDHDHGHDHGAFDPHAWQDLANGMIYVDNIAAALAAADPAGQADYEANAAAYKAAMAALDGEIRASLGALPESARTVVTSHDAFAYFGHAYGIVFLAPEGMNTDDEPSAAEVAALIEQIEHDEVAAVFVENISDNRVLERISEDTGAAIGGTLYSDALSGPDGQAPSYLAMMRHNAGELAGALQAF